MENVLFKIGKNGSEGSLSMKVRRSLAWFFSCFILRHLDTDLVFFITEDLHIYAEWNGIRIHIEDRSDMYSLFRFAYGYYDFSFMDQLEDVVVLDIGSHVGVSSLFFAGQPNVRKVYSYEPIKENIVKSLANFELNSCEKDKIQLEHQGVSDENVEKELSFYSGLSFFSGLDPVRHALYVEGWSENETFSRPMNRSCVFRDAQEIVAELPQDYPIILKIDVEGEEEKILKRLFPSCAPNIAAVVGEFHYDFAIEQFFLDNDFKFRYHAQAISQGRKKVGCFAAFNPKWLPDVR